MTEDQKQNLADLLEIIVDVVGVKYEAGAIEHVGNLADIPDDKLDKEIVAEITDLMVYIAEHIRRNRTK